MQDNFDVHKWNKERYLKESNEPKPKDEYTKAEDKLYKAVTGEEPKVSTKNKMREPVKENANSNTLSQLIKDAIDQVDNSLSVDDFALAISKVLVDNYGSHNYKTFKDALNSELEND